MIKKLFFILLTLFLSSCFGKHNSDAPEATVAKENAVSSNKIPGDTLRLDLSKSYIDWKGTKMRGAGKHEGTIELKNGFLVIRNQELVGGHFIVDMSSISVTDIPEHEPIPRKNLINHLKSSDFFNIAKFPTSEFQITSVKQVTIDSLMITGNLTIKNITKGIEFGAIYRDKKLKTKFTFNRFHWNINHQGSWKDNTFIDKEVELTIECTTQ